MVPLPDVAHDERLAEARERLLGHPPTVAIDRDDIKRTLPRSTSIPSGCT